MTFGICGFLEEAVLRGRLKHAPESTAVKGLQRKRE
jgi:hypothetical protein